MAEPALLPGKIKYESELDPDFARDVAAIPGGEGVFECIQCGTCSGVCPVSLYMDYTPRRLINMVRGGFREEVLNSRTLWLCTSCYTCQVNCPAGIHITDLMYALKRLALAEQAHPKRFSIPILIQQFVRNVWRTGRNNELRLVLGLLRRTNPLRALPMAPTGLKLVRTGRMDVREAKVDDPEGLRALLERVREVP